jgi:hypothetical protein
VLGGPASLLIDGPGTGLWWRPSSSAGTEGTEERGMKEGFEMSMKKRNYLKIRFHSRDFSVLRSSRYFSSIRNVARLL